VAAMTDNKRKTGIELIKSLHEVVSGDETDNVDTIPIEEVCLHLKKNGIDHERVTADVRARLSKLTGTARLNAARAQRLALANKSNGSTPVPELKAKITELLSSMQLNNQQVAAAFFRKFESAPDDDLESLYHDLQELQQLDKDDAEE
jgi:ssDNA-binding replication factor A large subunit